MRSRDKKVLRAALACILTPLIFGAVGALWTACTPYEQLWYTCKWQATTVVGATVERGTYSIPAANESTAVILIGSIVRKTPSPSAVSPSKYKYQPNSVYVDPSSCTSTLCSNACSMGPLPQGLTGSGGGNNLCSEVGGVGGGLGAGGGSSTSGFGGASSGTGLGGNFGTGVDSTGIGVATSSVSGAGGA